MDGLLDRIGPVIHCLSNDARRLNPMTLMKTYFKFSAGLLGMMYAAFACCALVHEWGHALCAWMLGQDVTSISVGTGPIWLEMGLLHLHTWMCGGLTSISWTSSLSPLAVSMMILAGSLAVLLGIGLLELLKSRCPANVKEIIECIILLLGMSIAADLCPLPGRDAGILASLFNIPAAHPALYALWILVSYGLEAAFCVLFVEKVLHQLCPASIRMAVLELPFFHSAGLPSPSH